MKDIPASELTSIYKFAIELAKDSGKILLDGIDKRRTGEDEPEELVEKLNAVDIVTQTDNGTYVVKVQQMNVDFADIPQMSRRSSTLPSPPPTQLMPSLAKRPTARAPPRSI